MRSILLLIILFVFAKYQVFSQNVYLNGEIQDSLLSPLVYANIFAVPQNNNLEITYAISDNKGTYSLKLVKNETYELTISYLGYTPQKITLNVANKNIVKDFTLKENPNQLETVELNYTPPVTVKKDTITYSVDKFTTGEERKLSEVLKKLPGVEVDRVGNVMVQGKKVTKVLVEDKIFFTGDSKLAVNNIPADAVDKVEVLDNYNEVAMLKGLQDSDDMAMNIKLKENKKKFAFGDLEAGAGLEERYLMHPSLFYYSPKTNVNLIGDINNTGSKSFTFNDYLDFEGGFGKLLDDASSYFSLYNSDVAQFLTNQDYTSSKNLFGAFNIRQSLSNATDISTYIITSKSDTQTQNETINEYLLEDNPLTETRETSGRTNNFFTIGKLTLDYDPNYETDVVFNSFVKFTNNESLGSIVTQSSGTNNQIATSRNIDGLNLKQNLSISKKINKDHTATLETTYNFQNDKPVTNWITNQQILQGFIPLEVDNVYDILQTKKSKSHLINAIAKDYWVLNNFNHLYTSIGVNVATNSFYNKDVQQLGNGSINNFSSADFGNDFNYKFFNAFLGLEYKFQIGIATFKPALFYHYYHWNTKQFDDKTSNKKWLALPQLTSKIEFNNSEKINFKYRLNARFPVVNRLASNFVLSSFNRVFKGNETLENQLYHTVTLSYYKFSLFKNLNINAGISYNKKVKHFKNVTQLNGIEQYSTQILFEQPEHSLTVNGSIAKKINKIRYRLRSRFTYGDFYQIVNSDTNLNVSKNTSTTISAESFFKNFPNLEIGYTKDFNKYRSLGSSNNFENDQLFVNLEYDFLKDFILKADYSFDSYKNKNLNIKNTFDIGNASLFYQKEDSSWGFEVSVYNIFDVQFKQQNSFTSFLISDNKTFILPRIIMFKLSYKL
jgi:hypothetical protein